MSQARWHELGCVEWLRDEETGELLEYVPSSVYERVVGTLQARLREQNEILAANITVDTWELWKSRVG